MNKILAAIAAHAEKNPQHPALITAAQDINYAELYQHIVQLSQWLAGQGVQRIGLSGENSAEWIIADLAAWHAGLTVIPLPAFFSATQLNHVEKLAELQMIVYCGQLPTANNVNVLSTPVYDIHAAHLASVKQCEITGVDLSRDTISKITFTSGTTGTPKGVCLSTDALERVTLALSEAIYDSEAIYASTDLSQQLQRHLILLPLSTLLENIAGVYVPLYLGKTVVVLPGGALGLQGSSQLSVPVLLQALQRYQPNSLILLPQILRVLVMAKMQGASLPESLKFVALGGGHTPPELIRQARSLGIPVYEGYGLSECASVVSLNNPSADCVGSVGKPLSHVDIKIEEGAIFVRGNVFSGYLGQTAMSADEWLDTGDLGYIDVRGFIHINGRRKNILISSFGRNISPEWVEAELLLCPAILQAMIVGDARPYCSAIIVSRDIDHAAEMITTHIARINNSLPDYAQIKQFLIADAPFSVTNQLLTENGRLRRQEIIAAYQPKLDALYEQQFTVTSN